MAEAYQASLRLPLLYSNGPGTSNGEQAKAGYHLRFYSNGGKQFLDFDYTSLLLTCTEVLGENGFMKEINEFVEELTDTESIYMEQPFTLRTSEEN